MSHSDEFHDRPFSIYLVGENVDEPMRAHEVEVDDNWIHIRWFPNETETEVIPLHRVNSIFGPFEGDSE